MSVAGTRRDVDAVADFGFVFLSSFVTRRVRFEVALSAEPSENRNPTRQRGTNRRESPVRASSLTRLEVALSAELLENRNPTLQ